jgi:hypothetical protein
MEYIVEDDHDYSYKFAFNKYDSIFTNTTKHKLFVRISKMYHSYRYYPIIKNKIHWELSYPYISRSLYEINFIPPTIRNYIEKVYKLKAFR